MFLNKIVIENFKLLEKVEIETDRTVTIIVGRNNSGKTSFFEIMTKIIYGRELTFNDYPIKLRSDLYTNIENYLLNKLSFAELKKTIKITTVNLFINYNDNGSDDFLGFLSPFIIDLDESNTTALITAKYDFNINEENFIQVFEDQMQYIINGQIIKDKEIEFHRNIRDKIKQKFSRFFSLKVFAVNSKNQEDCVEKTLLELKNLFPICYIRAERGLDENDGFVSSNDPFENILKQVFNSEVKEAETSLGKSVEGLKELVNDANLQINSTIKDKMNTLVSNSIHFGYPNADELSFSAETNIDISSNVVNSTKLLYTSKDNDEVLPSGNNGLGYKNLIKIELILTEFSQMILDLSEVTIPLLFIEEPESHMHPQLQRKFIEYLNVFLEQISNKTIQTFITTHSSGIVNSVDLQTVRYCFKNKTSVLFKDMNDYIKSFPKDYDFVKKFLKIDACEVFFADKLILIEGTCERLLVPHIINNLSQNKKFALEKDNLSSQYYSLIEIGGAHSFHFISFINFLQIPSLLICDIDSAIFDEKSRRYCKEVYSKSKYSTNSTIKYWLNKEGYVKLSELENKIEKTRDYCHIEYQNIENGLCGRSLEESIINVNRSLFGLDSNVSDMDLKLKAKEQSKTDFAINLLLNNPNFEIPSYIKNGLLWLDNPYNGGTND
ncbi:MAG: AAA family ATPase [Clostridia bacterium]|nr:AAA family ATPase [Clostridia bacterium]